MSRYNSGRDPFCPRPLKTRIHFPASLGKESRSSRRISRGGGLNLKVERNTSGRATVPKDLDVPILSRSTDSTALTRLSPRGLTQNMVAGVTALWHLERKPQIPMSTGQKAWHYFSRSSRKGNVLLPVGLITGIGGFLSRRHRAVTPAIVF